MVPLSTYYCDVLFSLVGYCLVSQRLGFMEAGTLATSRMAIAGSVLYQTLHSAV